MKIIKSISSLKKEITKNKTKNRRIGFVPTMGALHEGHLSLIRKCRRENDICIISIFVNPIQFGPSEDLAQYPRDKKKDKLLAQKEKVDIIFYPSKETIYPRRFLTNVEVTEISDILCGKKRKGHFRGVTTIVAKLLNLVEPETLYLGQKDFQQTVIIQQMVKDLNFNVKIKIGPTVREKDGLALSSRNAYLNIQQRREAGVLYRTLKEAKKRAESGKYTPQKIINFTSQTIRQESKAKIEYIECVDAVNLKKINNFYNKTILALAAKFGKTRLIDNITINGTKKNKTQT